MRESQNRYNRTLKGRYTKAKCRAKKQNILWAITFSEFRKIIEEADCTYCKGELSPTGSGLDRKRPDRGYVVSNVAPCCGECNRVKGADLTFEEAKVAIGAVSGLRESKKDKRNAK